LSSVVEFFSEGPKIARLGVASFGPLDVDPVSTTYGTILDTPKPNWSGVSLRDTLAPIGVEAVFQTDVVGAALAEWRQGAAQGVQTLVYVTVGTGIGAGVLHGGEAPSAGPHAEFGHFFPRRAPDDDEFKGVCPFHGDCLEGLASAPAMAARWGSDPAHLSLAHAWQMEAHYLAQGCVALMRVLAPQRIVLGGGVMRRRGLLSAIRTTVGELLGGYHLPRDLDALLVPPALGDDAGLAGALSMAEYWGA
jgi:fructokinase